MNKSIVLVFLIAVILDSGCKKESAPVFEDSAVIESYLKPGDQLNVRISRQVAFSSDAIYSSENIDSLSVYISVNDTDYMLVPVGNGLYKNNYRARNGDRYQLHFFFNGEEVYGTTTIPDQPTGFTESATTLTVPDMSSGPPSSMPEPIELNWENPDTSYYLVVVENIESNPVPIRDTSDGRPERVFRNQPTTSNVFEIRAMQFQYYGTHRIILYHLNPDYAYLYSDNNSSSQNLSTPQSDITNGLGIFTGINSDTLLLEVSQ